MRRTIVAAVAAVIALCAPDAAFAAKMQTEVPVSVNEYVEMVEIVARLADYEVFNNKVAPAYQQDIEEYFGQYRNHKCVKMARKLVSKCYIGYNAVPDIALNIEMVDGKFRLVPGDHPGMDPRWTDKAVRKFLPTLSAFYRDTDFHKFYEAHTEVYSKAVEVFTANVMSRFDLDWFHEFYNADVNDAFAVVIGLNNGLGNFSCEYEEDRKQSIHYAVMMYTADSLNTPKYKFGGGLETILVHEFSHSFIEPDEAVKPKAERLLEENRAKLRSVGYGSWKEVVEETFVRAATIRYMIDHDYDADSIRQEIDRQHEFYGFIWMPLEVEAYKRDIFRIFDDID